MRSGTLAVMLFVAACGKPPAPVDAGVDAGHCVAPEDAGDPDAGRDAGDGGDFSCAGQAPPAGAVQGFTVDGTVTAAGLARNPVDGALVELFDRGGAALGSILTSDGGRYLLAHDIGCDPFDGYMRASKPDAGFFDVYYYPPAPWRQPRRALELVVFDAVARALVSGLAGVTIQNGTGALALGINDCAGDPVSGAKVTSMPMGDVRYVNASGVPVASEMATTGKGQLLIFNLPPGPVQVTATVGTRTYPMRTVEIRADVISSTSMSP